MITPIKFLKVLFNDRIQPWEIPAFRGAMVAKVGKQHDWFHNHLNEEKYLYRYPKIQYKCAKRRPMLVCLHEGVDEIHKLFDQPDWTLQMQQRSLEMSIYRLELHEFNIRLLDKPQRYQLHRWVALNEKNYTEYQQLNALTDKISFLEQKLASHIISFAKSIQWHIHERFEVKIAELSTPRWVKIKNTHMMSFDLLFDTRVFLPDYLGLGRKVSLGFGTVKRVNKKPGFTHIKPIPLLESIT